VAAVIQADEIDYRAYERETEPKAKVRRASVFRDELNGQYAIKDNAPRVSIMRSTKLRSLIEFRPGEVTAWAGYSGHRKSMFSGQVALDLIDARQRVLIASMEMQPERTLARMGRQASAQRYPLPRWVDQFMHWTDGRLWLFDHFGRITPSMCMAVCRYFAEELQGQHVFIDSMMMVCSSEERLDEQKQFVTDLCRLAQETGLHVHLVAHCRKPQSGDDKPPTKYDVRGSTAITDQVGNVITVWMNKAKRDAKNKGDDGTLVDASRMPDAVVSVEKQRFGAWEGRVQLWFDDDSMRFCDDRDGGVEPYVMEVAP
jgi:twinkle protein